MIATSWKKVVYNLLSNAFKFSEDGEMVAFGATYENDELSIEVSDSGRGISEDKLPFIFDPFLSGGTRFNQGEWWIGNRALPL